MICDLQEKGPTCRNGQAHFFTFSAVVVANWGFFPKQNDDNVSSSDRKPGIRGGGVREETDESPGFLLEAVRKAEGYLCGALIGTTLV